ncbi:hypothetical protein N7532_010679 [Penicillium argentinense]|uniref:Cleavage/polyadenylation specificity factor A subunit N-terminal domain-containing protein n=1 Tax=Penicillium argentinense TaxID=1131581 RepID=A0A9W9EQ16_9EURO|nr:uncharacterized protein N7532_010679 [Penicillium argentinense]KAJ5085908.1 hypothetical protein N7532_010679 [Penicillium argentinense]
MSEEPDAPLVPDEKSTGILTQTLFHSPVIQWILPARLRSKKLNDVVFVGHRRVQIKEATNGGYLEDVIEKTDFNGTILSARVLDIGTPIPWESQTKSEGSSKKAVGYMDRQDNLPSQILVLSLDCKELLFLYCPLGFIPSKAEFVTYCRPLPVDVSVAERYGKHVAVDPKSRAVAVGAASNYFGILLLKSPGVIDQQVFLGELDPIEKESFYRIDGKIVFMEFLFPKTIADEKIILLLIVARDNSTFAEIYEWNENDSSSLHNPKKISFKLHKEDRLPSTIVPLTKESSFLVISSSSMATRYGPIIPDGDTTKEVALWTHWTRPARNWLYSQQKDGIYLAREDGWIHLLEFGNEGGLESDCTLGQVHIHVDTGFAFLDMGHEGGDFILASGNMSDGGLFEVEARCPPRCIQQFPNWAPVTDAVLVHDTKNKVQTDVHRNRIFTSSASASSGALHEIRYGIEAQLGTTTPLEQFFSIRDMWAMMDEVNDEIYVLLSDPLSSLLLCMKPNLEEGITALHEEDTGFDNNAQTFAAGCTPEGVLIQVTERTTNLFVPGNTSLNTKIPHGADNTIAAVVVDGPSSSMVTSVRRQNTLGLYFSQLVVTEGMAHLDTGPACGIDREPICLSFFRFEAASKSMFIFMGTGDGTVVVFKVEDGIISHMWDCQVSIDRSEDISNAIESLATIQVSWEGIPRAFLLCGLRSGILVPFQIGFANGALNGFTQQKPWHIGRTSLRLQSQGSFALFTCGDELWRVSYSPNLPGECLLWRVWITDQNNPAYFPVTFHGFGLVNQRDQELDSIIGTLYCFADGELLICSLNQEAKMVPRRIGLPGNPVKVVFSEHLNRLLVSYNVTKIEPLYSPLELITRSHIEFVDPDLQSDVNPTEEQLRKCHGAAGEIITCILDWVFERNGDKYHLIVLGTSLAALNNDERSKGRVIILRASASPSDPARIECATKHVHDMPGPVRAIAPYGDSLIIGAGKELIPMSSKGATIRWAQNAGQTTSSPVVSISVYESFINVTTARNGFQRFEVKDGCLHPYSWDVIPIAGMAHQICRGEKTLVFLSSRGGRIRAPVLSPDTRVYGVTLRTANNILPDSIHRFLLDREGPSHEQVLTRVSGWSRGGALYGFALSGALYRFKLVGKEEFSLLWLLQVICLRGEIGQYANSSSRRRRLRSWREPEEDNSQIDGDVLNRLAKRGTEAFERLISSLDLTTEDSESSFSYRLKELAFSVLEVDDKEYLKCIMAWLQRLLHITI